MKEDKKKFKSDTTLEEIINNTFSMCITGALEGRSHDADNSRVATEYVLSSVRNYLENYTNDYTVDLFLDNIHQIMRKIYTHVSEELSNELDTGKAVHAVIRSIVPSISAMNWRSLILDMFPKTTNIDLDSIEALEMVEMTNHDMVDYINPVLLRNPGRDSNDQNVIFEDDNIKITGGSFDSTKISEEMPNELVEFLKMVTNGGSSPVFDDYVKEIGDTVNIPHVINTAYLITEEGVQEWKKGEDPSKNENGHLVNKKATVIATRQNMHYKCNNCDEDHDADLMIYFPHVDKKYFINSDFVQPVSDTKI